MFLLEWIFLPIFLYSLIAIAAIVLGSYKKNQQVPNLEDSEYRPGKYEWKYTKEQKAVRDRWECVQVFSFAWPFEAIIGIVWGIIVGIRNGFKWMQETSSNRSRAVLDRKLVVRLEEERAKLLELTDGRENGAEFRRLQSVEEMLGMSVSQRHKALTSG